MPLLLIRFSVCFWASASTQFRTSFFRIASLPMDRRFIEANFRPIEANLLHCAFILNPSTALAERAWIVNHSSYHATEQCCVRNAYWILQKGVWILVEICLLHGRDSSGIQLGDQLRCPVWQHFSSQSILAGRVYRESAQTCKPRLINRFRQFTEIL